MRLAICIFCKLLFDEPVVAYFTRTSHVADSPAVFVDQINDQAQLGRVLKLVLRLVEDQPEQALLVAEVFQGVAVVVEELVAVLLDQRRPGVFGGNIALLIIGRLSPLVGHFEEEQIGELFDVVAVAHAVVAQDVAEVPEFADNCCWGHLQISC